jgi:hypothetical protein
VIGSISTIRPVNRASVTAAESVGVARRRASIRTLIGMLAAEATSSGKRATHCAIQAPEAREAIVIIGNVAATSFTSSYFDPLPLRSAAKIDSIPRRRQRGGGSGTAETSR